MAKPMKKAAAKGKVMERVRPMAKARGEKKAAPKARIY